MLDPARRIAAAVAGVGVLLCVLGWYQISGQPTVAQQLPYLASATIPGAALLVVGLVLVLRTPLRRGVASPAAANRVRAGRWRVPDGRYVHAADCPLLDGRTDLIAVTGDAATGDGVAEADDSAESAPPAGLALTDCPLCSRR